MSDVLSIATSALNAIQLGFVTIGNNIANVNTDGYSKQTVLLQNNTPQLIGGLYEGSGVQVASITRSSSDVLTSNLNTQTSNNQQLIQYSDIAINLDKIISDPTIGVAPSFKNFFSAFQTITSDNAASSPERQVILAQSQTLVDNIQSLSALLNNQVTSINQQIQQTIPQINQISSNIAQFNSDIISSQGSSSPPNDLLDQRDVLINQLANLVGVSTVSNSDGSVDVFIGSGQGLVVGTQQTVLGTQVSSSDPTIMDILILSSQSSQIITSSVSGGSLGGLLSVKSEVIDPTLNGLGALALTLAYTVNSQHQLGMDTTNNIGAAFFNDINDSFAVSSRTYPSANNSGTAAFNITINPIPLPDPGPFKVYSTGGNLSNTGTLTALNAPKKLIINNQAIRNIQASDDTVSPATDQLASAIATAAAINASTALSGVTANVEPNTVYLGSFTAGALAGANFTINGTNINSAGTNETTIIQDINAASTVTGVIAMDDGNHHVILVAQDGRNIQLDSNGAALTAGFTLFNSAGSKVLSQVQKASVTLTGSNSIPITVSGFLPGDLGFTPGTTPPATTSLSNNDYSLSYNSGVYTLLRTSDNVIMAQGTSPNFSVDGFTIQLASGSPANGDSFSIRPTHNGSQLFAMNITQINQIALALPIRVGAISNSSTPNQGSAIISVDAIVNTSGTPTSTNTVRGNAFGIAGKLTPPITIQFDKYDPTIYRIYDTTHGSQTDLITGLPVPGIQIGPNQKYNPLTNNSIFPVTGVADPTLPGPNSPVLYDPGYRVSISGAAAGGDQFTIDYNTNGFSDNTNGLGLIALQTDSLLNANSSSYEQYFAELVTQVGSLTSNAIIGQLAAQTLQRQAQIMSDSLSGVNLEEEAVNLMSFQQAYQAAAHLISIEREIFQILYSAFGA